MVTRARELGFEHRDIAALHGVLSRTPDGRHASPVRTSPTTTPCTSLTPGSPRPAPPTWPTLCRRSATGHDRAQTRVASSVEQRFEQRRARGRGAAARRAGELRAARTEAASATARFEHGQLRVEIRGDGTGGREPKDCPAPAVRPAPSRDPRDSPSRCCPSGGGTRVCVPCCRSRTTADHEGGRVPVAAAAR